MKKDYPHKILTLLYFGDVIRTGTAVTRRQEVKTKLHWRKLYGARFRVCDVIVTKYD